MGWKMSSKEKPHLDIVLLFSEYKLKLRIVYEYNGISPRCMNSFIREQQQKPDQTVYEIYLDCQHRRRRQGWMLYANEDYFETDSFFHYFWSVNYNFTKYIRTAACQPQIVLWSISVNQCNNDKFPKNIQQKIQSLRLCKIYGNRQLIVCMDDMEQIKYEQTIFNQCRLKIMPILTNIGYDAENTPIIPVSAMQNDNIRQISSNMPWYTGYKIKTIDQKIVQCHTIADALENVIKQDNEFIDDEGQENKPLRMTVTYKCTKIKGLGILCASGRIDQGILKAGMKLRSYPTGCVDTAIKINKRQTSVSIAKVGDHVGIQIGEWKDRKQPMPQTGDLMVNEDIKMDENLPNPYCKKFVAVIDIEPDYPYKIPIQQFVTKVIVRLQENKRCRMVQINWKCGKSTDYEKVKYPAYLECGDKAEVIFEKLNPLIVYPFAEYKVYSRMCLMDNNYKLTVGYGKVIELRDDRYFQKVAAKYIVVDIERKYNFHVVHDIQSLIFQFVSQDSLDII